MDRSRRQRKALQIDPSTAAGAAIDADAGAGQAAPRHLEIRLQPRSRRDAVVGEREGAVLIALKAAPVDGAANAALVRFLAERLHRPRASITLVRGASSRTKWIALDGGSVAEARRQLLGPLQTSPAENEARQGPREADQRGAGADSGG
ncbi:MAG: hypothetical protein RLZZ11_1216 [Cyanobacteriota bacterium]|jgi:uncharacterized protein